MIGGGYAEYCLAHEGHALPVPTGLSMAEAAAIPETFFTVWHNVFERGGLKAGETLLVHGGSSGIGTAAIQLAKAFGARVIATAGSAEKCEACRKLGADLAVNYKTEDFVAATKAATDGKGADVILDMVGGDYIERNYEAAAVEGRIVQIAFQGSAKATVDFRRIMLKRLHHTGSTLRARSNRRQGRDRARGRGDRLAADRRRPRAPGDGQDVPAGRRRRRARAHGIEPAYRQDRADRVAAHAFVLPGVRLAIGIVAVMLAAGWRSPVLAGVRAGVVALLILVPLALVVIEARRLWVRRTEDRIVRAISWAVMVAASAALAVTSTLEAQFQRDRYEVRHGKAERLERLGRHIIVGYRDIAELEDLVRRRAVAGVFVTARNVEGLSAADIRRQIEALQDIRTTQGLPPLWIATDQEGGIVSRMSPPLTRRRSLSTVIEGLSQDNERAVAARRYGEEQGRELAALGVNLNFAPVIDLDRRIVNPQDKYTRISQRAISHDPAIVTDVARQYCAGLRNNGVDCTLKHFPGLGRVFEDTHVEAATLTASRQDLDASDWIPFRDLMRSEPITMLSHVRLAAVDPSRPASFSEPVVSGLLRGEWRYDGLLITDDFSMGASMPAAMASPPRVSPRSMPALI